MTPPPRLFPHSPAGPQPFTLALSPKTHPPSIFQAPDPLPDDLILSSIFTGRSIDQLLRPLSPTASFLRINH
jgi:hypothetical protein